MKKLKGFLRRKQHNVVSNKPHLVVKVDVPNSADIESAAPPQPTPKTNEPTEADAAEYKKLGKIPYRAGKPTKGFLEWFNNKK